MHPYAHLDDTIVALATPPGTGAIGIIRLSGSDAFRIAGSVFRGKDLGAQPGHTVHFGTLRDDHGRILDEVLATVFRGPHSYTREDVVEFSCHGSPYLLQQIVQLLIHHGARMANPGEFTLRAFLNGRMDLSQAEAVADLIAASSESAHRVAMNQMRGGFSGEIRQLREELIHFASLIELELDFSEEDVEFANRDALQQLVLKIRDCVLRLLESFRLGNVIRNGINTVIAGRPNAGKSTLLNALLNEDRAIVSEIAGTTRDTIEEVLNIRGVTFRLIDTAGIREARDQIEAIGVQKTLEKIRESAILVYVFDVVKTSPEAVRSDLESLDTAGLNVLLVPNKMDLNPYTKPEWYATGDIGAGQIVTCSALNHMNIEYLKEKLYETALSGALGLESTVVTNARHYEALTLADAALGDVLRGLDTGISSDFVAMDIRRALHALGTITGEVDVEDLLDNIFRNFCIGK